MVRLIEKEKEDIIYLLKEGKSLNYISSLTNRNKSTLYEYYKKLFGKKFIDIDIDQNDYLFIGELIGLFVGDGSIHYYKKEGKYCVRFFLNYFEGEYVKELANLFKTKLKKEPCINRVNNVLVIRYYSKKLFNFLLENVGWIKNNKGKGGANKKSTTVFLKNDSFSKEFKIGFLRGFIDTDGYLSDKKILFGSTSEKIMQQTESFLRDLNFKNYKLSFYKDKRFDGRGIWHLYVHKCEREKFMSMIMPRNLTKVKQIRMRRPGVEPGQSPYFNSTSWKGDVIPLDHQRLI